MRNAALGLMLVFIASLAWARDSAPLRVVALGGDVTETVYLLDAQRDLVGVDSTSEWPSAAKQLPDVGYVRQLNAEGALALHPSLIIATHDAGPPAVVAQMREAGVPLVSLPNAQTAQDTIAKVKAIGHLLGKDAQAGHMAAQLEQAYATLATRVAAMPHHPKVVFLLSAGSGQLLAAGRDTAADHAIKLAGGHNAIQAYSGYKPMASEALVASAPEAIVVMSEHSDGAGDIAHILALPEVAQTPAGRHRRIVFVDGQALLGFGPRNADHEQWLQTQLAAASP